MRTFIGIAPDPAARQALAACVRALAPLLGRELRWIGPANLHITLAFLGEVQPPQRQALSHLLQTLALDHGGFELRLDRLIYIPGRRRPRVLAWRIDPHPALLALQQDLYKALAAQGMAVPDRRFMPHLSIARVRAGRATCLPLPARPPMTLAVRAVSLYASRLAPGGAQYSVLQQVALAPAGPAGE